VRDKPLHPNQVQNQKIRHLNQIRQSIEHQTSKMPLNCEGRGLIPDRNEVSFNGLLNQSELFILKEHYRQQQQISMGLSSNVSYQNLSSQNLNRASIGISMNNTKSAETVERLTPKSTQHYTNLPTGQLNTKHSLKCLNPSKIHPSDIIIITQAKQRQKLQTADPGSSKNRVLKKNHSNFQLKSLLDLHSSDYRGLGSAQEEQRRVSNAYGLSTLIDRQKVFNASERISQFSIKEGVDTGPHKQLAIRIRGVDERNEASQMSH